MIGYVGIEEQVDADFARARGRALLRRIRARLWGGPYPNRLLPFEEAREALGAVNRIHLGRRVVPVAKIVGSVGRHADFDGGFLPLNPSVEERWKRVDRAFHRDGGLPPVSLYKIGDRYFVEDGNHRVSVARYQGVGWIEANVVEFLPSATHRTPADGTGTERVRPTAVAPLAA